MNRIERKNEIEQVKKFLHEWGTKNPYAGNLSKHNEQFRIDSEAFIKSNPNNKSAKWLLR